jgi:propionyl-CoA carboxylase alpha chain
LQPPVSEQVRVDSGVGDGGEVSMFYDPMVAKLVTHAATRDQAITAMRNALDMYWIRGIETNIPFLATVMAHPRFKRGDLSTHFIDEEFAHGFDESHMHPADLAMFVIVAGVIHRRYRDRAANVAGQMAGHERKVPDDWVVCVGDEDHPLSVRPQAGETQDQGPDQGQVYEVRYQGACYRVQSDWQFGQPIFSGAIDGQTYCVQVERDGLRYRLLHGGGRTEVLVCTPLEARMNRLMPHKAPPDLSGFLLSPMPGLLLSVAVSAGDEVKLGQELAVVEAMKMENVLRAERDQTVKAVLVTQGESLAVDQKILAFE